MRVLIEQHSERKHTQVLVWAPQGMGFLGLELFSNHFGDSQVTPQKVANKSSSFSLSFDKRDDKVSLEITSKELDSER